MKIFISSLENNNGSGTPLPSEAEATAPVIDVSVPVENIVGCMNPLAINYNPFATVSGGSCVFEQETIEENEVTFLALIGHSQIAGKGLTNAPGVPVGDYLQNADKILNDMQFANGLGSFALYNPATLGIDHGREAYLNAYWKNYLDASNGEPLYVAKTVVVGAAPHSKFMIGGRYWENSWNNQIRPKINQLIALGKKVSIHFIFDMWADDAIYGLRPMYDVYHSHWCIARALGIQQINANLTSGENNANWKLPMNQSFNNYVAEDTTRRSISNGVGLTTVDGVHWSSESLKMHALNHLAAIELQPKMKINWNVPAISGLTMAFKEAPNQRGLGFSVEWDVPCEVRVFTDSELLYEKEISMFSIDIRLMRYGFVTLIGNLTGMTRFLAPFTGICVEFELLDKHASTLKFIDMRGNALIAGNAGFIVDYSNDYNVMKIAQANVSNGVLKISESVNGLTAASRSHYDTLISRGWTIDVVRP